MKRKFLINIQFQKKKLINKNNKVARIILLICATLLFLGGTLKKQAELYSKNAETDAMNAFMGQFMAQFFTNPQGMEEQMKVLERLGNMGKRMQG